MIGGREIAAGLLAYGAMAVQVAARGHLLTDDIGWKRLLILGSYLVLLVGAAGLLTVRRGLCQRLLLAGVLLNLLPTAVNGGLMPVAAEAVAAASGEGFEPGTSPRLYKDVVLAQDEVRLSAFSDWIRIPGTSVIASPGDLLLLAATTLFVAAGVREAWLSRHEGRGEGMAGATS